MNSYKITVKNVGSDTGFVQLYSDRGDALELFNVLTSGCKPVVVTLEKIEVEDDDF